MRRILVGLDGSPLAETILPFVEMLARRLRSRVTLLHVSAIPERIPPGTDLSSIDHVVQETTHHAERYLREHQRRLSGEGIETAIAVVTGNPAREIVRYAERGGFDLLALATHGRSGLQRWTHGSVTDRVLHTTAIPLLLVRPGDGWAAMPRSIARIVVPLDGSPAGERALQVAEPLAVRWGVPLALLRFVEPFVPAFGPELGAAAHLDLQAIVDTTVGEARGHLERTAAELCTRGVPASTEVSLALPAEGIATYVHRHPDSLLVLATHGHAGWRRVLLGSVARRVAETVAVPILFCPPPPHDAALAVEARA